MTNTIKIKCIQYLQPEACDTWHQGSYPHCEPPFPRFTLHPPSSNDRDVNWRIEVYLLAFHKILTRFQFRIETRLKSYFIILSIIIFVSSESCNGFWKIEGLIMCTWLFTTIPTVHWIIKFYFPIKLTNLQNIFMAGRNRSGLFLNNLLKLLFKGLLIFIPNFYSIFMPMTTYLIE